MTGADDRLAVYHRAQQLGRQVAHGQVERHDAGRSAFYLSHTLAHRMPQQPSLPPSLTQAQHYEFMEYLIDEAAKAEHHRIVMAEASVRDAVHPLIELDLPNPDIERAATEAADGGLTPDEIAITVREEMEVHHWRCRNAGSRQAFGNGR